MNGGILHNHEIFLLELKLSQMQLFTFTTKKTVFYDCKMTTVSKNHLRFDCGGNFAIWITLTMTVLQKLSEKVAFKDWFFVKLSSLFPPFLY